jgi:asparagine synthase (glutamine-hydrolysing)
MCGIAGIIKIHDPKDGPPPVPLDAIPEAWLDILDESIKHRGPDGQGRFRDRAIRDDGTIVDIALVHRRLSIIDHEGGHQPMVHDGERLRLDLTYQPGETPIIASEIEPDKPVVAVVFNGCIYNHRELRQELEAAGHVFETDHSDTEVLVHGWREWGNGVHRRLSSMHGIAYWDQRICEVVISRDRFGEKPLYFTDTGVRHAICSSPNGLTHLLASTHHSPKLAAKDLIEWIAFGQHTTTTPCIDIAQCPHGSWRAMTSSREGRLDSLEQKQVHKSFRISSEQLISRAKTTELIDRTIEQAVAKRLDADVPIACFLSGGLDSSLVARAAQQVLADRGETLQTLCVRMPDPRFDESSIAREIADIIGSNHLEIDISPTPAVDLIHLIESFGLPFGDSSLLPTYWVSQAASKIGRVAIGGDGGDELFLGYERQNAAGDLVPLAALSRISMGLAPEMMPRHNPRGSWDKAARMLTASSKRSYRSLLAIFQHPELRKLAGSASRHCKWNDRINDAISAMRYDLDHYLPGDLLRKVDTASMACPVEVRNPLLDEDLCKLSLSLPLRFLRNQRAGVLSVRSHSDRKGLLKQVARRHFPDHIVDRPKQGFAIPIGEWFRTDYGGMRQLLYDHLQSTDPFPGLAKAGVEINMKFVNQMLREHDAAGEKSINPWHGRDHSQRLYMLLVLSIWSKWLERVQQAA